MAKGNLNIAQALVQTQANAEVNSSRITQKMPSMENVVAGNTAVLRCPVGLVFYKLVLKYSGVSLANMQNITIKIGTKVIRRYKNGNEVSFINKFYGRSEGKGMLTFHFTADELNDLAQRDRFSVPTLDASSFNVEIDIDAGASNPVMQWWAVNGAPNSGNTLDNGQIIKVRRLPSVPMIAGENDITTIPALGFIKAVHFMTDSLKELKLLVDTKEVLNVDVNVAKALQKQAKSPRVPQEGGFTLDWTLTGTPASALRAQGVADLRFKPIMQTTENVDIVIEYIDSVGGAV